MAVISAQLHRSQGGLVAVWVEWDDQTNALLRLVLRNRTANKTPRLFLKQETLTNTPISQNGIQDSVFTFTPGKYKMISNKQLKEWYLPVGLEIGVSVP